MKLKKLFTTLFSLLFILSIPVSINAETITTRNDGPHPYNWSVLVLILPDTSIEISEHNRQVTTMHYAEIKKVTEVAKSLENSSTNRVAIHVDVKTDYTDVTEKMSGTNFYNSITAENVKEQLANNSEYNQYDSIMVVYRDVDENGNMDLKTNNYWSMRNNYSNNASYCVYRMTDSDHNMSQFNKEYPENEMLGILLESVRQDLFVNGVGLDSPYNLQASTDNPREAHAKLMNYINSDDEYCMGKNWTTFLSK